MEKQPQQVTPILDIAWRKFGQFDVVSGKRSGEYLKLRKWIALFGVLATLFAILTALYPQNFPALGGIALKGFLIASPLLASFFAAYANKFYASGDWLITRAGAEEVLKEIYVYRTILQGTETRRTWLETRLQEIQRSVYRGMNGELVMDSYEGVTPPPPRFQNPDSDPGFSDLTGDEYFQYRLEDQLNWHVRKLTQKQKQRVQLQLWILTFGAMGALLAAFGGGFTLWVALAASLTTTFIGWQELSNLDVVVRNYSKVRLELSIIADHWNNLEPQERTQTEFFKMVRSTEEILWSRNMEYIKAMQEALKESDLSEEASLVNRVIQEQRESDLRFKRAIADEVVDFARTDMKKTEKHLREEFKAALGSLAEEASSELVQAELASMRDAIQTAANTLAERFGISSVLKAVEQEFAGVEIGPNTPPSVLNDMISRYPRTINAKG
ncbi:MAG: SLATT domain-containing protein [Anaerolineales bacterium]|nr:SLATT domain-containing protein [Anaerolineales bacterium]